MIEIAPNLQASNLTLHPQQVRANPRGPDHFIKSINGSLLYDLSVCTRPYYRDTCVRGARSHFPICSGGGGVLPLSINL